MQAIQWEHRSPHTGRPSRRRILFSTQTAAHLPQPTQVLVEWKGPAFMLKRCHVGCMIHS